MLILSYGNDFYLHAKVNSFSYKSLCTKPPSKKKRLKAIPLFFPKESFWFAYCSFSATNYLDLHMVSKETEKKKKHWSYLSQERL